MKLWCRYPRVMQWVDGSVKVNHPREPWERGGGGDALIHCRLDQLKGTAAEYQSQQATYKVAYARAKYGFDLDIAYDIIERCKSDTVIDSIVDIVYYSDRPIIL